MIALATSSDRSARISRNANITRWRATTLAFDHSSNAAFAEATAASTSELDAMATDAVWSPVAGLNTGPVRPEVEGVGWLSIQWAMVSMARPGV